MTDERHGPQIGRPRTPSQAHERPVSRLEAMIENLRRSAAPVLREAAARAADVAANAGEAAGPLAHRAAAMTEGIGGRVADRGRGIAADLRRGPTGPTAAGEAGEAGLRPYHPQDTVAGDAGTEA